MRFVASGIAVLNMGKTAFLFAGQGAQKQGMALELQGISKVDELFKIVGEQDKQILEIIKDGSAEQLAQTYNTQRAMFVADLAYAYASESQGVIPDAVCGFSVGEIPALCYAGVFSVSDGLKIIAKRAELMSEVSQKVGGAMVAVIGLTSDAVEQICNEIDGAWTANYNSVLQTVVAVTLDALPILTAKVSEQKGKALRLKVSGAFHCPLLSDAGQAFGEFVKTFKANKPTIDVYANTTAMPYGDDVATYLANQMQGSVQFTKTIANMKNAGITEFIEVGPGKVLTGLVGKINIGK